MGDCTIGKELKQSTCRYVKKCKEGWVRNDKYICRKTLRRTGKRANNNSPVILTGNVARNILNSPNESVFGNPKKKPTSYNEIFGNSSPNELPKKTNEELEKLFESPNENPKIRKRKSRKNFRLLNNLTNSPNELFDLKKHKQLSKKRLRKTKDINLIELLKRKERKRMERHARKIAQKYNVIQ